MINNSGVKLGENEAWPDPTPEMLETKEFNAVWNCIKKWDISTEHDNGLYSGATGNHVRAILDALNNVG